MRVVEPAFSEYAIACRLAGIKAIPVWGGIIEKNQCVPTTDTGKNEAVPTRDLLDALTDAPEGSAVFLANPGNPSGLFRTPEECLRLMSSRSDLLWIIDEAFVEYAGTETEASVLQRLPKNGIVLRSLTKFHAVPGVRLGYLAADAELAQAIRDGKITFFVAKRGYRAVGMCSISRCFSTFACTDVGIFDDFYIEPVFRKKGTARLLAQAAQEWSKENALASLTVTCASCDEGMYQALGFDTHLGNTFAYLR